MSRARSHVTGAARISSSAASSLRRLALIVEAARLPIPREGRAEPQLEAERDRVVAGFERIGDVARQMRQGTVNLIGSGRDTAHEGRSHERLCPSGHAGDLGPGLEGLGSGGSILGGGAVIAAEVEQVVDLVVSGEEALGLAG